MKKHKGMFGLIGLVFAFWVLLVSQFWISQSSFLLTQTMIILNPLVALTTVFGICVASWQLSLARQTFNENVNNHQRTISNQEFDRRTRAFERKLELIKYMTDLRRQLRYTTVHMSISKRLSKLYSTQKIDEYIFVNAGFYQTFYQLSVLCEYLDTELLDDEKPQLLTLISKEITQLNQFEQLTEMKVIFSSFSNSVRYLEILKEVGVDD